MVSGIAKELHDNGFELDVCVIRNRHMHSVMNTSVICFVPTHPWLGLGGLRYAPMLPTTSQYALGWVLLCSINRLLCLEFN